MENKRFIIYSFVIITITLAMIVFFSFRAVSQSPTELEKCNTFRYNGENKIDLVFIAKKGELERYYDTFMKTSPFKQNLNEFNFYYIDSYIPNCEKYKGIALLCNSKEIIKKAASCPNDFVIVVKDEQPSIRSSSYMNVISLNINNRENVFIHEFGHAFANLADEYVPAEIPRNSKNCVSSCDKFEECFKGCSKDSYFRSIEAGLMRTLSSSSYGEFNEELIKLNIEKESKITGRQISEIKDCSKERYYLIEGNYNGEIEIISKSSAIGCLGNNGIGTFNYSILLSDNSKINQGQFNPELIFTDSEENEELTGGSINYSGQFILKIPAISNAEELEISTNKETIKVKINDIDSRPCKI